MAIEDCADGVSHLNHCVQILCFYRSFVFGTNVSVKKVPRTTVLFKFGRAVWQCAF